MTHIDRPVHGQRNFFKHRAVLPPVAGVAPKYGMRDRLRGLPVPVIVGPERTRLIAACCHELEVLPVRYLVLIDLKRRHACRVRLVFVVPAESLDRKSTRLNSSHLGISY